MSDIPISQIPGARNAEVLAAIVREIEDAAGEAITLLLENRHLYQTVDIDLAKAEAVISAESPKPSSVDFSAKKIRPVAQQAVVKDIEASLEKKRKEYLERQLHDLIGGLLLFRAEETTVDRSSNSTQPVMSSLVAKLVSVHLYCPKSCKREQPHNLGSDATWGKAPAYVTSHRSTELHLLPFQCQGCRGEPVVFMVRRQGVRLTLVGRHPIEAAPVPTVLPEPESKFFSHAVVAFQSGQILPALFMLRTFIEQVWSRFNALRVDPLPAGTISAEVRGSAYQNTLPGDFKQRFPSLISLYGELSAAMHDAKADIALFERAQKDIVRHFEARRLFQLEMPKSPEGEAGEVIG